MAEGLVSVFPQESFVTSWENIAAFVGESRLSQGEALDALLRSGRCILWQSVICDMDGILVWHTSIYNEIAAQAWLPVPIEPGETYAHAWWKSRLHEDRERTDFTGNIAVRNSLPGYEQEYRVRRDDGEILWLHEDATIEPLGEGRWRVVGVCTDITESKRAEEESARRAAKVDMVADFARYALEEPDIALLSREATLRVSKVLDATEVLIWELLPDGQTLVAVAHARANRESKVKTTLARAMAGYAIQSRSSVVVADSFAETRFDAVAMRVSNLRSGVAVLIEREERIIGALGVYNTERCVFSETDVGFCEAMANILAVAFQRERMRRLSMAQHVVAEILAESETPKDAYAQIIEALCLHLDWDLGELWGWIVGSESLCRLNSWKRPSYPGVMFQMASKNFPCPVGTGLPGHVWESGLPMWVPNIVDSDVFLRKQVASLDGLQSAVAFPVLVRKAPVGVICLYSTEQRLPDETVLASLATIGRQIGQFVERSRALDTLVRRESDLARAEEIAHMDSWAHELGRIL